MALYKCRLKRKKIVCSGRVCQNLFRFQNISAQNTKEAKRKYIEGNGFAQTGYHKRIGLTQDKVDSVECKRRRR